MFYHFKENPINKEFMGFFGGSYWITFGDPKQSTTANTIPNKLRLFVFFYLSFLKTIKDYFQWSI